MFDIILNIPLIFFLRFLLPYFLIIWSRLNKFLEQLFFKTPLRIWSFLTIYFLYFHRFKSFSLLFLWDLTIITGFFHKFKDFITAARWKFLQKLGKSNSLSDKRLKVYMLYDRVMRNIRNRHKRIKHMNSFINARFQRKPRKFSENPLSGCQVSGQGYHH